MSSRLLSCNLWSQTTHHHLIASYHAQSLWQSYTLQIKIQFKTQAQQTIKQVHALQTRTLFKPWDPAIRQRVVAKHWLHCLQREYNCIVVTFDLHWPNKFEANFKRVEAWHVVPWHLKASKLCTVCAIALAALRRQVRGRRGAPKSSFWSSSQYYIALNPIESMYTCHVIFT